VVQCASKSAGHFPHTTEGCMLCIVIFHRNSKFIIVPNSKSRNIPEVVIARRGAGGVLGIWGGWVSWVKGGANGVSLQAT
jgi:hypothetical protein